MPNPIGILEILVEKEAWMTLKDIMKESNIDYDNGTERVKFQRQLKQLVNFDFIRVKEEDNHSLRGWGHKVFKAKKRCKRMIK